MGVLSNPKWELFAQALAKGKTADEAYQLAGYAENRGNASRLKANDSVMKRVAELQEAPAKRLAVTLESLLMEAEEIREKALLAGSYAAAIAAVKEKGVLSGVRVEKRENTNRNLSELSDAELERIAAGGSGEYPFGSSPGSSLAH
jgi:hypothetical protein